MSTSKPQFVYVTYIAARMHGAARIIFTAARR